MANIKELRGRIRSVGNISKITRAMEMVASMKLRRVQARALSFRPYTEELRQMITHLADFVGQDGERPLFRARPVRTTGVFLITSDRGLCGAYNANVLARFHALEKELRSVDPDRKIKLYVYGRKGYSYLYRRGYEIERYFTEPPLERVDFTAARLVGKTLVDAFEDRTVDDVHIVYTAFESAARFAATALPFLPLTALPQAEDTAQVAERSRIDYLLEPNPVALFDLLIPRYLETIVYDGMLESLAAELANRRMAMKGATDAATRMGKELKRVYNRARQETITKELLDIIGGANAVA